MTEQNKTRDFIRENAINLFTFLRELTQLRTKNIRTLENYAEVLWLCDIPREQGCFTQAWGITNQGQEDIWIEIKKPRLPSLPDVPEQLRPWVRKTELLDLSKNEPSLLKRIFSSIKSSGEESEPTYLYIEDYPQLIGQWKEYLDRKWRPWAAEYRRLKPVQEVYSKLFTIYQEFKSLGEEFELIIAIGLLGWLTENHQRVYRHLVTAQASIAFDTNKGILTVGPAADGCKIQLEQDMLEASERPRPEILNSLQESLSSLGDEIWDRASIDSVLRSWVQALSAQGTYLTAFEKKDEIKTFPIVSFSPVLILRKRTERGLLRVYQEIIEKLTSNNIEVPEGIRRVVEVIDDHVNDAGQEIGEHTVYDNDIYFPLPTNAEQEQIIKELNSRRGVLVQGPPGTGKSHTIVNLICHLLATGNRVLVTSQTARALKVLKGKILNEESTKDISDLCVSLLGNDSDALKDLGASVDGITSRHQIWNPDKNSRQVKRLKEKLDKYRRELSQKNRRLREIRESETYKHSICDGVYRGTALHIARQLSEERKNLGWLDLQIEMDEPSPLSNKEALELLQLFRSLSKERIQEIKSPCIGLEELPTPEDFVRICAEESEAEGEKSPYLEVLRSDLAHRLQEATPVQQDKLLKELEKLLMHRTNVMKACTDSFISDAVNDIFSGRAQRWQRLHDRTTELLEGLLEKSEATDKRKIQLGGDRQRDVVLTDARSLIQHMQTGGGFGLPGIRPKPVKVAWYIIKEARVNGRPCNNMDSLKELIDTLEIDERLGELWNSWSTTAHVNRITGSRAEQVLELMHLNDELSRALSLKRYLDEAEDACKSIEGLVFPAWHEIEDVKRYHKTLEGIQYEQNLESVRKTFEILEEKLHKRSIIPGSHFLNSRGLSILPTRDERSYGEFYKDVSSVAEDRCLLSRRDEFFEKLRHVAPRIANSLSNTYNDVSWDDKMSHFTESWAWAKSDTWLKEFIHGPSETELVQEIENIQSKINNTLGKLSAALAWRQCFERLTEENRQHLVAWKHAMRRIGKATGKYTEKYRREAREHLEGCRKAIPAWIMPLYRVAESLRPVPDAYDVVIIDEASQAGVDAVFLQYIAKKIVVVGDDMQISPDSIGVSREDVEQLRERHLKHLPSPHVHALGVEETSFFHLAEVLFGGRITLREHFRCMPEIIQFSNDLCYRNNPLLPLRQYPPDRLEPVVSAIHVTDGYREGGVRTPRNPPEAQTLADKIVSCCNDASYRDKTMGVISLLGKHQGHLIRQKLIEAIGPEEMERRKLICGDAYAFQGDERDIIFLSLVAAPGETGMRAITDKKSMRRFNVAASRAKDQMWLFHTPTMNDFRNKECLRYRLLDYCLNPRIQPSSIEGLDIEKIRHDAHSFRRTIDNHPSPFGSWFEVDVFLKVIDRGYRVIPQFEVAGYFIDLVVEGMRGRLAVECDGDRWHGPERYEDDMKRQRILERCEWTFWRIRGSEFYLNPERALASLWEQLDRLHITPTAQCSKKEQSDISLKPSVHEAITRVEEKHVVKEHREYPSEEDKKQDILKRFCLDRPVLLEALLSVLPSTGKMSRGEAIRKAAGYLKDKGHVDFQRVRVNGRVWSMFKSAINSGIRRGVLSGDSVSIWKALEKEDKNPEEYLLFDKLPSRNVQMNNKQGMKNKNEVPKVGHINRDILDNTRDFSDDPIRLKPGDRVSHDHFGLGTIIKSDGIGKFAKVKVKFDKVGIKKLRVDIARIKKITT